jgi:hypothetical protein
MERTKLDDIIEMFPEETFLKADGYDDCIIGYEFGVGDIRLIYSVKMILDKMVSEEGLDEIEAIEHFEFNMRGGYVGEQTPIWCQDDF